MQLSTILLFASIIMMTYIIEGIIGFGGTILALPLAAGLVGMKTSVDCLVIVVLFASLWVTIRDRANIDHKALKHILFFMLPGLPIGMWLFAILPERPLKCVLGLFMIFVGLKGFIKLPTKNHFLPHTLKQFLMPLSLFLGGIIHGAFTCGGPFVVIYAKKEITDKTSFRATLCTLWALLNAIMLVISIFNQSLTSEIMVLSLWTMPFIVIALWLSNFLHHKIKAELFTHIVNGALIISGILMMK